MLPKRLGLPLPHRTNIQPHRPRHHHRSRSVRNRKVRRHVIQPLRFVRISSLRIPLRLPRPMKRRGCQHRNDHVIGMRVQPAIAAERHHHIRLESPDRVPPAVLLQPGTRQTPTSRRDSPSVHSASHPAPRMSAETPPAASLPALTPSSHRHGSIAACPSVRQTT